MLSALSSLYLLLSTAHAEPATAAATAVTTGGGHFPPETVALFSVIFVISLFVDLVQHRGHKDVSIRSAAIWSLAWIAMSLAFCGWLRWHHGDEHPEWWSLFLTGYVLEKTLSVDNLIVFIAIFRYFRISSGLQHRILYYGILGAIVFRALFVAVGTGLLAVFGPWAEIVFGAFVAWAGVQMLMGEKEEEGKDPDYESMLLVRIFKRFFPVFPHLVGDRFFIGRDQAEAVAAAHPHTRLQDGVQRWMTPAFVCLLVVEGSDVLFSVDSVPAVIAVTKEPLIVYTAMIFAVLGLRSLYFIVEVLTRYLVHLEKAVIFVLFFIAAKMFVGSLEHLIHLHVPWWSDLTANTQANYSMLIVLTMLGMGVIASFIWPGKDDHPSTPDSAGASH